MRTDVATSRRRWPAVLLVAVAAGLVWSCGGDADRTTTSPEPALSAEAAQGKQLGIARGCMGCHSVDGRKTAGPTWKGAYGSETTLTDGTKVLVDDAYLVRAIKDPWAEKVKGFTTVMPRNSLPDAEVNAIVAYIRAIGKPAAS
jgi:cytochrome c oxidase subunit 2